MVILPFLGQKVGCNRATTRSPWANPGAISAPELAKAWISTDISTSRSRIDANTPAGFSE